MFSPRKMKSGLSKVSSATTSLQSFVTGRISWSRRRQFCPRSYGRFARKKMARVAHDDRTAAGDHELRKAVRERKAGYGAHLDNQARDAKRGHGISPGGRKSDLG